MNNALTTAFVTKKTKFVEEISENATWKQNNALNKQACWSQWLLGRSVVVLYWRWL